MAKVLWGFFGFLIIFFLQNMRCCSLFSCRRRILMTRNNIFFFKFLTEMCPWFLWSVFRGSESLSQFWPAHRGACDSWSRQVQVGRLTTFVPCHLTNVAVTTGGKVAAARCWEEICRLLLFLSLSLPVMTAVLTASPPQVANGRQTPAAQPAPS